MMKQEIRVEHGFKTVDAKPYKFEGALKDNPKVANEFCYHKQYVGEGSKGKRYTLTHIRSGVHTSHQSKLSELEGHLEGAISRMGKRKFYALLSSQNSIEEQKKIDAKTLIENNLRKKMWKELSEILGFTPNLDGFSAVISNKVSIDVIKLDSRLRVPDGVSTKQHITKVYGKRAAELTEALL